MSKPYPWYYAVNDRPVKIVQTPDGGADCLVFDFQTGGFVPDRGYFSQVLPGSGRDVDQLTEAQFEQLVAAHRADTSRRRREIEITWQFTDESGMQYRATVNGQEYAVMLNPPDRPMYTLLINGQPVESFQEWPLAWTRPRLAEARNIEAVAPGPSVVPSVLRRWSEQLCRLSATGHTDMAKALGFGGSVENHGQYSTVEPPPAGTTKVTLHTHVIGFDYVEIYISRATLTRELLDLEFSHGEELPRVGPHSPFVVAYEVRVQDAPFHVALFAAFTDKPNADAAAHKVTLRRD